MSNQVWADNAGRPDLAAEQADFRLRLRRFVEQEIPGVPPTKAGRGIVTSTGGPFTAGTIVGLRLLRELGCDLPVEVWFFGSRTELTPRDENDLADLGCRLIDADNVLPWKSVRRGDRYDGWRLKPVAVAYSGFREVLWRDGDCYDVEDPTTLFDDPEYVATGAQFWPDLPWEDLPAATWEVFGLEGDGRPAIEAGQFTVDTVRSWDALAAAVWLNRSSDFTYRYVWGDKETFPIGWRVVGRPYAMARRRPTLMTHSLVHWRNAKDDGSISFTPQTVHRARNKITLDPATASRFVNTQQYFRRFKFVPTLPREAQVWGHYLKLKADRRTPEEMRTNGLVETQSYYVLSVMGVSSRLVVLLPDGEFGEGANGEFEHWAADGRRLFFYGPKGTPAAVFVLQEDEAFAGQQFGGGNMPLVLRPLSRDAIRPREGAASC
jgi:hypothetical protein